LQIYREGKRICGPDLDVTREKSFPAEVFLGFGCGGFGGGNGGVRETGGCVLVLCAMFCNRWKDRFFERRFEEQLVSS
jgi:hypothetical protein